MVLNVQKTRLRKQETKTNRFLELRLLYLGLWSRSDALCLAETDKRLREGRAQNPE